MKSVWRISLLAFAGLLVLLIFLPVVLKGKIAREVREQVNRYLPVSVEWSGMSAGIIKGFPGLQITLQQLSVKAEEPYNRDTLATMERMEMNVNPFRFLTGKIIIRSIRMEQPRLWLTVEKEGNISWDRFSFPPQHERNQGASYPGEQGGGRIFPEEAIFGSLQTFELTGGELYIQDHRTGTDARIGAMDVALQRELRRDSTLLGLKADLHTIDVSYGGIRYMRDGTLGITLEGVDHAHGQRFTLTRNIIELNGLLLEAEGELEAAEGGGLRMDLGFRTQEGSLQRLLSLVPAIYVNDLESLETGGEFNLEGKIQGVLHDSLLPDASLTLNVMDGAFSYPGVPGEVSDIRIHAGLEYHGTNPDDTRWNIEMLHMVTGRDSFDMSLQVSHPVSDMLLEGKAVGEIDFSTLGVIFPMEELSLDGKLISDLSWNIRLSDLESENYEKVSLKGTLELSEFQTLLHGMGMPLQVSLMEISLDPRWVELKSLRMKLGTSDMVLNGKLTDLVPYLAHGQPLHGNVHFASGFLDVKELLQSGKKDTALHLQGIPAVTDSVPRMAAFRIPDWIGIDLSLALGRVRFGHFTAESVSGSLLFREGAATFNRLNMQLLGGDAVLTGSLDTRGESAKVSASIEADGIDIPTAYRSLVSLDRIAPMARYCSGNTDLRIKYFSLLNGDFTPRYGSITATGNLRTNDLKIYNQQAFISMGNLVNNEKFRNMAPDEVEIDFAIRNSRVYVEPFGMQFDDSGITASGSHGFDQTLDYVLDLEIAKKDLGPGASGMLSSLSLLATAAGLKVQQSDYVKVKAFITGTFEAPRVRTDLSGNLGSNRK